MKLKTAENFIFLYKKEGDRDGEDDDDDNNDDGNDDDNDDDGEDGSNVSSDDGSDDVVLIRPITNAEEEDTTQPSCAGPTRPSRRRRGQRLSSRRGSIPARAATAAPPPPLAVFAPPPPLAVFAPLPVCPPLCRPVVKVGTGISGPTATVQNMMSSRRLHILYPLTSLDTIPHL